LRRKRIVVVEHYRLVRRIRDEAGGPAPIVVVVVVGVGVVAIAAIGIEEEGLAARALIIAGSTWPTDFWCTEEPPLLPKARAKTEW